MHNKIDFAVVYGWHTRRTSLVLKLIKSTRNSNRILDIGCNDGAITAQLREIANAGETYGVDVDHSSVEKAKSRRVRPFN
jgi:ribosomal protein L11 methylase PrmA